MYAFVRFITITNRLTLLVMGLFKNENTEGCLQCQACCGLGNDFDWCAARLPLRFDVTVPRTHTRVPSPSVINTRSCLPLQVVAEGLCTCPNCLRVMHVTWRQGKSVSHDPADISAPSTISRAVNPRYKRADASTAFIFCFC